MSFSSRMISSRFATGEVINSPRTTIRRLARLCTPSACCSPDSRFPCNCAQVGYNIVKASSTTPVRQPARGSLHSQSAPKPPQKATWVWLTDRQEGPQGAARSYVARHWRGSPSIYVSSRAGGHPTAEVEFSWRLVRRWLFVMAFALIGARRSNIFWSSLQRTRVPLVQASKTWPIPLRGLFGEE
jgi:hypothetical protein